MYPQLLDMILRKWVHLRENKQYFDIISDSKIPGANMGPTWVLSAPDGPHVGLMNLAIWDPDLLYT